MVFKRFQCLGAVNDERSAASPSDLADAEPLPFCWLGAWAFRFYGDEVPEKTDREIQARFSESARHGHFAVRVVAVLIEQLLHQGFDAVLWRRHRATQQEASE